MPFPSEGENDEQAQLSAARLAEVFPCDLFDTCSVATSRLGSSDRTVRRVHAQLAVSSSSIIPRYGGKPVVRAGARF